MPSLNTLEPDWRVLATRLFLQLHPEPPGMHPSFHAKAEDYSLEVAVLANVFREVGNLETVKAAIRGALESGELDDDFAPLYRRLGCKP